MARRQELALDRQRMIAAAFEQLDEVGLDALSMRRLAARLDVQAPALYWHVRDKAELLGWMVREIYARARGAVAEARDPHAWLHAFGRSIRATLAGHRDSARLCAIAKPAGHGAPRDAIEEITAPLAALGLSRAEAILRMSAVISLALGWATFQANGPMHDFLDEFDFDGNFDRALAALIDGMDLQNSPPGSGKLD